MADTEISSNTTDTEAAWDYYLKKTNSGRELVKKVITRKFENGELVEERIEEEWESARREYIPSYPYYPYPQYPTYPSGPYYNPFITYVNS